MHEELNPLARQIISLLVFEETFGQLLEDVKNVSRNAVSDELKTLIAQDFVKPCRELETGTSSGLLFDSDKLESYSFRLSAKGMKMLEIILKSTKK